VSAPSFALSQAETRLPNGVRNSQRSFSTRKSLLFTLDDGAGMTGLGEASPLDGYGPDTFGEAQAALAGLSRAVLAAAVDAPELARGLALLPPLPASARFAVECALAHLSARRRGLSLDEMLSALAGSSAPGPAPPHAALVELGSDLDRELAHARRSGARTFKAKIGLDAERELSLHSELLEKLHDREVVRLDLNRAAIAPELLPRFADPRLEFVEEPFAELPEPRSLPVPVALDESVVRAPERVRHWVEARALAALVLKPMTLGLVGTLGWVEAARRADVPVVISHCFDGSVAFAHYHALARAIGPQRFAMGIGAHPGLALWSNVPVEEPA
jgi:o-succinylbenzoate synthase